MSKLVKDSYFCQSKFDQKLFLARFTLDKMASFPKDYISNERSELSSSRINMIHKYINLFRFYY